VVPDIAPMLATGGLPTLDLDHWAVEPKIDGWRCLASVDDGHLAVQTRRGRLITDLVPELRGLAECGHQLLLDGELCAGAGRLADFAGLSGRLAGRPRAGSAVVSLVVFDILWLDGVQLTGERYDRRREILRRLQLAPPATVVPSFPLEDAPAVLRFCEAEGLEGLVFKRLASPYRSTRSRDWRKVKCSAWADYAERRRAPQFRGASSTNPGW
jgi:bifunctional non-homologous end joining protein LigD